MDQPERVRYFEQQFLREEDFNEEQVYHRDMRRRHNRMLHTPGISDGLQLEADGTGVTISPGSAVANGTDINGGGAEIVLADTRRQELSSFAADADIFLTIQFAQEPARERNDAGVKGFTRWRENPVIEAFPSDPTGTPPSDPNEPWRVLLGKVKRAGKNVVAVDMSIRPVAGSAETELTLTPRLTTVPPEDHVRLRWSARGQAELLGNLNIVPSGPSAGDLTVAGKLGVGTKTPQQALDVTGNAIVNTLFAGDVGHGAGWAALTHRDAIGVGSYGLLMSSDGRNTFLNKRSGAGRIEFRVDNSARLSMDDGGSVSMGSDLFLNGKLALRGNDGFLRLNQAQHFPAGTHAAGLFSTERLNVGGIGGYGTEQPVGSLLVAGNVGVGVTAPQHPLHVAGNAVTNTMFIGDLGYGPGWATLSHRDAISTASYALLTSNDGRNTFLNKRSGPGAIEFRVDNSTKLAMNDAGTLHGNGKEMIATTDAFLRLNQAQHFKSGVHTPGLFTAVSMNVGGQGGWGTAQADATLLVSGRVGVGVTSPLHALHVAGNTVTNNVFIGDVGHGATWAAISHRDAIGVTAYSLLTSADGKNTFLNKKAGGGTIELRVDNITKLAMDDGGTLFGNGKQMFQSADSWLRLNQGGNFASGVWTPGVLCAGGNVGVGTSTPDHRLTVAGGDIMLDGGTTLRSRGRMHIHSPESLYLLAVEAVRVSGAWGGPGNLHVDSSVYINGYGPGNKVAGDGVICWDVDAKGAVYSENAIVAKGDVVGRNKRFVIDHPLDPEHRQLVHACIEGPEAGVYYRGESRLSGGRARVELPHYFEALCREEGRTLVLTPKYEPGREIVLLAGSEIRDAGFEVHAADGAAGDEGFYWEVKAVRADIDELEVEVGKAEAADARRLKPRRDRRPAAGAH